MFVAMITHQDDPQVQEVACRAVSRILESDPAVVARIGEEEEQLSLHNCVFAAMNIHLSDQYVFQAACCALHDLATKSNRLQQLIVAKGTYVTIIDHMRENPRNPGIQVLLLILCNRLLFLILLLRLLFRFFFSFFFFSSASSSIPTSSSSSIPSSSSSRHLLLFLLSHLLVVFFYSFFVIFYVVLFFVFFFCLYSFFR